MIDKQLEPTTPAPAGLEVLIEGEGTPPEITIHPDGSVDIELEKDTSPLEGSFDENLAEIMDKSDLMELATQLLQDYDDDCQSRKEWVDTYIEGIKLLGLKYEDRTEPFPNASGVFHPMITEAVVRFQAELVQETLPASGPVRTQVVGKETPQTMEAAARVEEDMNFRLTQEMVEYRPEHEKLGWHLPIAGSGFKKVYFDPSLRRQVAMFIPAEDLVVPYGASSLETAERITHVMRKTDNEMRRLQVSKFYRDIDLDEPPEDIDEIEDKKAKEQGVVAHADNRYRVLEMHVYLDLPGYEEDIPLPYIVTIEKHNQAILSIRRNWLEEDTLKLARKHFVHYTYVPGFGFYGFGLIHLIGGHARTATSLTRQLIDAGTLANLPGGLKAKSARIKGDTGPIGPGQWRDVDVTTQTIKDSFMPLPYKEPSPTLMTLLASVAEDGRRFANTADMNVSDMSGDAPVGTTLAILERQLKVMSAVQARVHYAMRQEFRLLKGIIRDNAPEVYEYDPAYGSRQAKQSDYDLVEVIPVSDPNAATMSQKIVQMQAVIQLAQQMPQVFDQAQLARQLVNTVGVKNAEKLVPLPEDKTNKPKDPISENANLLMGKPVKAFIHQNHEAHIAAHMSMTQDPKIQQLMQNNPAAQQISAAVMAHVMEHLAMGYKMQASQMMGVPLPDEDDSEAQPFPPQVENQIAQMAAQAAQQITGQNQQAAQQAQAQQQAQDPLIQMQQQELALKERELQRKEADSQRDFETAQAKVSLEQQRIQADIDKARTKELNTAQIKLAELQQRAQESEKQRRHQDTQNTLGRISQQIAKPKEPK